MVQVMKLEVYNLLKMRV